MTPQKFRALVWKYWKEHGRHDLPWRKTTDPYKILVSEVMLQQTQVERVIPYYKAFLKKYPTVQKLAEAPLRDVLTLWQGLGYNRRAKMLHEAAKVVVHEHGGKFLKTPLEFEKLPGIGPYTAGAVAAFAYNADGIFIETNIRTAITHHFFPGKKIVHDSEVLAVLSKVFPKGRAREWYAALMDYGAHLKRSGVRINKKAKGYAKQIPFKGSDREARGALLRALAQGSCTRTKLLKVLGTERKTQLETQLTALLKEELVIREGVRYTFPL
jgi:A/G-specific adenine glycosylase